MEKGKLLLALLCSIAIALPAWAMEQEKEGYDLPADIAVLPAQEGQKEEESSHTSPAFSESEFYVSESEEAPTAAPTRPQLSSEQLQQLHMQIARKQQQRPPTRPSTPVAEEEPEESEAARESGYLGGAEYEYEEGEPALAEGELSVFNGNSTKPVWFSWKDDENTAWSDWKILGNNMRKPTKIPFIGTLAVKFSVIDPIKGEFIRDDFAGKVYVFDAASTPNVNISATSARGKNPETGLVGWYVRVAVPTGSKTTYDDIVHALVKREAARRSGSSSEESSESE